MTCRYAISTILFGALALLGACADETEQPNAEAAVETTYSVIIKHALTDEPLAGVKLCTNIEGIACATTGENGQVSFSASMVHGEMIQFRGDKDGFFPFLAEEIIPGEVWARVDGEESLFSPKGTLLADAQFRMLETNVLQEIVGALGKEITDTKGHIFVVVLEDNPSPGEEDNPSPSKDDGVFGENEQATFVEGATVTIDGQAGIVPKYLQLAGVTGKEYFGEDADGTTSAGIAAFFNVEVGTFHVTVKADGHSCFLGGSGLPSTSATAVATTEAGRITYVFVICRADD